MHRSPPLSLRLALLVAASLFLAESGRLAADEYSQRILPLLKTYCVRCHEGKTVKGQLDLAKFASSKDVAADFRRWHAVVEMVRKGEMPPADSPQPTLAERNALAETVEAVLIAASRKNAGDPGTILPRRLSATEYDLSIRDLIGVDVRATREFPPDPAGGEGFDNTGEALSMSPSLLKKYLQAAHDVSTHLVLRIDGLTFAPFPVTSYNERKKLVEGAIIDFYRDHEVRLADYLEAAWRFRHRPASEQKTTIAAWAARRGLSGRYLALVWDTLEASPSGHGYLGRVGRIWQTLPAPQDGTGASNGNANVVPKELGELRDEIEFCRRQLFDQDEQLIQSNAGNWPIRHLAYRATKAAERDVPRPNLAKRTYESKRSGTKGIRFDKFPKPDKDGRRPSSSLHVRLEPAFSEGRGNVVLFRRPAFATGGNLPQFWGHEAAIKSDGDRKKYDADVEKSQPVTLRSVLEKHLPAVAAKLKFGRTPQGAAIDPDSFVVEAPAALDFDLPPEAVDLLGDRQLVLPCELDETLGRHGSAYVWQAQGKSPADLRSAEAVLLLDPAGDLAPKLTASHEKFCQAFPSRFFYVDSSRGLAAGFHLVEGFFRDDRPLVEKVLDEEERRTLDDLWAELDFVTQHAETLLRGFVWFERAERHVLHDKRFDFLRAEDPLLVEEPLLGRFERVYLDKMGVKLVDDSLSPVQPSPQFDLIHGFFQDVRRGLDLQKQRTKTAEGLALAQLDRLAARAYRRPLRGQEAESLRGLYASLRKQGQGVEDALRGTFSAILMSPEFFYLHTDVPPGPGIQPLGDDALASRLSYFLWSSLPDEELLAAAAAGKLRTPDGLAAQTRRMLRDPRAEAFAREFLGQWLRYRDYLAKDGVNPAAFPGYEEPVRQSLFEEPTRLATWLIREDRPILDLLDSDTTFVDGRLAKHYGGAIEARYRTAADEWTADRKRAGKPVAAGEADAVWHRVDGLRAAGRGGLFGMAVILAKNSAGERTSPVKRGFWTVHHLLGEHFPPPPPDVPELPRSEKQATKSIRELLAAHAADAKCAMCHRHFDGLGLALEGFDPIGRARTKDLGGRTIDDVALFPGGKTGQGVPALVDYVKRERQRDFVRTFCRKFLGYALGRSVLLSDQPLLDEMEAALERSGHRFSAAFDTVVRSPQFRTSRGRDFVATGE